MTNFDTTASPTTATAAEHEKALFASYLATTVPGQADSVAAYYLSGFECFGMDGMVNGMVNGIFNGDPMPEEEIDFMLQELSGLVNNLHRVKRGFAAYKAAQANAA